MKNIKSPEMKIAAVAIVAIVVLFVGLQFLKGLDIFSDSTTYKMKFNDIDGLAPTTPIYANGVKVGIVQDIHYNYENPSEPIVVDAGFTNNMKIPVGSTAAIESDLMGNVKVLLRLGESKQYLTKNGVINGAIDEGAIGKVKGMVPSIEALLPKLDSILANVNSLLADPSIRATLHNAEKISSDLTTSTKQLNLLMAQLNGTLPTLTGKAAKMLDNTNVVMANANNGVIEARGALKGANQMVNRLNNQLNNIDLAATMTKVNTTLEHVNHLTAQLNNGEGSLGLLLKDPSLYHNLTNTMRDADSLLINLKAHPKRYVHFSLFGRKDK